MMWRMLPDELKGCCATFLDTPSAGRFAAACHEGQRLVLTQLVLMKLVDAVAAQVAAQAAAEAQAAPRRIAFNAAGKNFIDAYVDAYIAAAPAAVVERPLASPRGARYGFPLLFREAHIALLCPCLLCPCLLCPCLLCRVYHACVRYVFVTLERRGCAPVCG